MTARLALACLVFVLLPTALPAWGEAGGLFGGFRDPTDGAFDSSDWLLDKRGFLPVPIIITEPTVGAGGGAALLFFHRSRRDTERASEAPDEPLGLPPSVSFAFGFGTEKSSWGAGGGHFGTWLEDSIRYTGVAAYTSLDLDLYVGDRSIGYDIEGVYTRHQMLFRLFGSNFFFGPLYELLSLDTRFDGLTTPVGIIRPKFDRLDSGLGFLARYDSRDNIFTPNQGQQLTVATTFFDGAFGGDGDFQDIETEAISYHSFFSDELVLGLRFGARFATGNAPFYNDPYVQLRGVPALRFQDEKAGEGEFELRWDLRKRWSLLGFFGVGWTSGPNEKLDDPGAVPAGGVGLRYLIARKLGMRVGLDVAFSGVDTIVYVQTGSAW